jgi:hypothetical protein
LMDYYLIVIILMVGFIELYNPDDRGLTLSQKSYLWVKIPNMVG